MKGNEARVVFFLHPVDQLKDGKVSRVKPLRSSFVVRFLFLLGLLLGLGVLVYVFLQFGVQAGSLEEPVSTTEVSFDTTTESAVSERITEVRSNQTKGNYSAIETEPSTEIISPGITCDSMETNLSNNTTHQHLAVERSTSRLLYPLVASSSLLLAYLAALIIKWGYSRSKLVQGWMRRLTGKSPKEEKMLLHTLPYYLAITRSSCEVS